MTDIIVILVTWIQVLCVIIFFGAEVLLGFVVIPVLLKSTSTNKVDFILKMSKKYSIIAAITSTLILLTGFYLIYANKYLDINTLTNTSNGNLVIINTILYLFFIIVGVKAGRMMANIDPAISQEQLISAINKTKVLQYIYNGIFLIIILIAVVLAYSAVII